MKERERKKERKKEKTRKKEEERKKKEEDRKVSRQAGRQGSSLFSFQRLFLFSFIHRSLLLKAETE